MDDERSFSIRERTSLAVQLDHLERLVLQIQHGAVPHAEIVHNEGQPAVPQDLQPFIHLVRGGQGHLLGDFHPQMMRPKIQLGLLLPQLVDEPVVTQPIRRDVERNLQRRRDFLAQPAEIGAGFPRHQQLQVVQAAILPRQGDDQRRVQIAQLRMVPAQQCLPAVNGAVQPHLRHVVQLTSPPSHRGAGRSSTL